MMEPGATAFTLILWGASASAMHLHGAAGHRHVAMHGCAAAAGADPVLSTHRVRLLTPPLLALYPEMVAMAVTAFTLLMLMIAPPRPCATICRAAAWPVCTVGVGMGSTALPPQRLQRNFCTQP